MIIAYKESIGEIEKSFSVEVDPKEFVDSSYMTVTVQDIIKMLIHVDDANDKDV